MLVPGLGWTYCQSEEHDQELKKGSSLFLLVATRRLLLSRVSLPQSSNPQRVLGASMMKMVLTGSSMSGKVELAEAHSESLQAAPAVLYRLHRPLVCFS